MPRRATQCQALLLRCFRSRTQQIGIRTVLGKHPLQGLMCPQKLNLPQGLHRLIPLEWLHPLTTLRRWRGHLPASDSNLMRSMKYSDCIEEALLESLRNADTYPSGISPTIPCTCHSSTRRYLPTTIMSNPLFSFGQLWESAFADIMETLLYWRILQITFFDWHGLRCIQRQPLFQSFKVSLFCRLFHFQKTQHTRTILTLFPVWRSIWLFKLAYMCLHSPRTTPKVRSN